MTLIERSGSLWASSLSQMYGPDRSHIQSSIIDPQRTKMWRNRRVGWLLNTSRAYPQVWAISSPFVLETLSLSSSTTRTSRQLYLLWHLLGAREVSGKRLRQNHVMVYWMRCSTCCVSPKERLMQASKTIRGKQFELIFETLVFEQSIRQRTIMTCPQITSCKSP